MSDVTFASSNKKHGREEINYWYELTMQKDADLMLFLKLTEHVNNQ